MAIWTSYRSGSWSSNSDNLDVSPWDDGHENAQHNLAAYPVAGDTVTIAATHEVLVDVVIGPAGLANLTLNSHASSLGGMIYFKDATNGTIIIADAGHIQGSATSAVRKGRILANQTGLWTGPTSTASTFANSQSGTTGAVTDGDGAKRIFTPTATPAWVVDALIGESMTINGTTYAIEDNDATTVTLTTGPAIGATVTSWSLVVRPLAVANTAVLGFLLTAHLPTQYLDVALYGKEPTLTSVRTYGQIFHECTVLAAADTLTYTGIGTALPVGTVVRVSAGTGALPAELAANTDYWVQAVTANTITLKATPGGGLLNLSAGGPINVHVGMYKTWTISANALSFTATAHGLANGTAVMLQWTGTAPTINGATAVANTMYYVVSTAANTIQLASVSGGTALTITGSPTTLDVYTGSTGAAPGIGGTNPYTSIMMNVLDDVSTDAAWGTGAASTFNVAVGLSAVVLADIGPDTYDQQRLGLVAKTATTVTFGAAVDSIQYPNARIWLASRNVEIQSTCVTAVNIVDATSNTSGAYLGCAIRSAGGTGVTFYGNGVYSGTSFTISGPISGCNNGVNTGTSHTISGPISGCGAGTYQGTSFTISGPISGCGQAVNSSVSFTISGPISGCTYGTYIGTSCTISGPISGCQSGSYGGTSFTISGPISGCTYGVYMSNGILRKVIFSGNTYDLRRPRGIVQYGVAMTSSPEVYEYKHAAESLISQLCGISAYDDEDIDGYIGRWDVGGSTKSAPYVVGTHGAPPAPYADGPPTCIHVSICEDSDAEHWVDIPLFAAKDQKLTVTVYCRIQTNTMFDGTGPPADQRPIFELIDPALNPAAAADVIESSTQTDDALWQTHTLNLTAAATADRPYILRCRARGGNAGGTGTDTFYWFQVVNLDYPAVANVASRTSYANGELVGTLPYTRKRGALR